jgi:hypothetical protein
MTIGESQTYYDVLEIPKNASIDQIREAYIRHKEIFAQDDPALYSLISIEDRQELLRTVERAYIVLSDPIQRKNYDHYLNQLHTQESNADMTDYSDLPSIDRKPPMDRFAKADELLIPPITSIREDFEYYGSEEFWSSRMRRQTRTVPLRKNRVLYLPPEVQKQIHEEEHWRGSLIKKIREAQNISLDELSSITKISKRYLQALEQEQFDILPATVYIRGFVSQVAKELRLPVEKVTQSYLQHLQSIRNK